MTVTPVTTPTPAGAGVWSTDTAAPAGGKTLDKEVFLSLLVAQLRNQDPSSPMDTTEMMAQSTQLASMEQLTTLTDVSRESFALQMRIAASAMVGQQVSYVGEDGTTKTGTVSAVSFEGPVPIVTVGGVKVPLDAVSAIASTTPTTPGPDADDAESDQTTAPAGDPAA